MVGRASSFSLPCTQGASVMAKLIALACRLVLVLALLSAAAGLLLIALKLPIVAFVLTGLMAWRRFRHRPVTASYGSATVATVQQMDQGGLLAEDGVILG